MLKAALAVLAGFAALARCDACAGAALATDLIVGSVRDQAGLPIARAEIRAFGTTGIAVGSDRSDEVGTFAISLAAPATRVEVRCSHCRTASFALGSTANLAIVVARYRALESDVPTSEDLAALPYGSPAGALTLVPFVLGGTGARALSDRGLGSGNGLVSDDGVALLDLATGTSPLVDFPDRYARDISVVRADRAYRYGSYAGGGLFSVDQLAPQGSLWADAGHASALAIEPKIGDVHPALGISADGNTLARRADVDLTTVFAGGALRAGATSATERRLALGTSGLARDLASARLAYATASRRYRTSGDLSASNVGVAGDANGASNYRSNYLAANVRLEHPGPVDLAAGLLATRQTTFYAVGPPQIYPAPPPQRYALVGDTANETLYLEAGRSTNETSAHAAVALENIGADETLSSGSLRGARLALLPAVSAQTKLGGGAYLRAGYSQSQRLPTLVESDGAAMALSSLAVERAELLEGALGYDAGTRLRAEAIAYREFTHGFNERRLEGIGASLVWQLAPLLSLRAWSLRATPHAFANSAYAGDDATRQVLWTTYENGAGLRFDAILHRDGSGPQHPAIALDGDAYVPFAARIALDLGTSRRENLRRYYFGLRLR